MIVLSPGLFFFLPDLALSRVDATTGFTTWRADDNAENSKEPGRQRAKAQSETILQAFPKGMVLNNIDSYHLDGRVPPDAKRLHG